MSTYPGADVSSNHNSLVADVKIKFKKLRKSTLQTRFDVAKMEKEVIRKDLNNNLKQLRDKDTGNVNNMWNSFSGNIQEVIVKHTRPTKRKKKKTG